MFKRPSSTGTAIQSLGSFAVSRQKNILRYILPNLPTQTIVTPVKVTREPLLKSRDCSALFSAVIGIEDDGIFTMFYNIAKKVPASLLHDQIRLSERCLLWSFVSVNTAHQLINDGFNLKNNCDA